jgi:hypothetical protein
MHAVQRKRSITILRAISLFFIFACQKSTIIPSSSGVAALTVVNAIPNSVNNVIPVIGASQAIEWFGSANQIGYENFYEYSPTAGNDTVYVVQSTDTLNFGPKASGLMFYNILSLKKGDIYSLFLCGADTTSPDYLFTTDTLPYYSSADSVMGIRFVNLSTGANSVSINLEGKPNGSVVNNLPYKGITRFGQYANNSTINDYMFVVRDAATGDSLTQYDFFLSGSSNSGYGLIDPTNGNLLTFKNITIALIGQPGINAAVPQSTMLIDDY